MTNVFTSEIHYTGNNKLDITVETGIKIFAPEWSWVRGIHQHTMSEQDYIDRYLTKIKASWQDDRNTWDRLIWSKESVVLCCFCLPNIFCHRYVLTTVLQGMGAVYCGELLKIGRDYISVYPSIMDRFFRKPQFILSNSIEKT